MTTTTPAAATAPDAAPGAAQPATATFAAALCAAQHDAMRLDETIVLLGQDVRAGFPFGATKGLVDVFGPDRVVNTPISEAATMGCGVGAALGGIRPVVEVDFAGFLLLGLDQLVNNGAKLRYMSGGQASVPLVVRVGQGPLGSFAAQHSQTQHAYLAGIPGLTVLAPATAQQAYDAMRWALVQDDPVVLLEDMRLYRRGGPLTRGPVPGSVTSTVHRPGTDLTILTFGHGVVTALQAAQEVAARGIDVEVLGLDSLNPLDVAGVARSVRRTGRVLCLADDPPLFGTAATLSLVATTEAHDVLRAPVLSLGGRAVPTPYTPGLEALVYPTPGAAAEAITTLMKWTD
ncbi:TPP-dependent acetoin dehydrogenase complex, E1 protein subunit beta [Sphaerisporangium rufum]|uniref:TPP-dependent acetoin dehydrogenase complex, E1 protein subunit beta n=1 Tax=Sphaerisporangium rufum TaxID=1381558 RepID=A0A919R501_9ACTN|nr:transketolase C-terminal domain-containing protein [Sphaerisporangium rufum]GII78496.1 TPP-dependent acetoin dehydrogenase complex, E1 protein subunit beta [Sphaerisporangium rufum]